MTIVIHPVGHVVRLTPEGKPPVLLGPGRGARGLSAYQIAVSAGFVGDEAAWLASLQGADGDGGADGQSAYQIAVSAGFVGDEAAWLASLQGAGSADGSAGQLQVNDGAGGFAGVPVEVSSDGAMSLPAIVTPATPAAGGVTLFATEFFGNTVPAFVGPDGKVQRVFANSGPDRYEYFNDFLSAVANDASSQTSGTGTGNFVVSPQFVPQFGPGWIQGRLGTTATGRCAWASTNLSALPMGIGAPRYRSRRGLHVLSNATTRFSIYEGFIDRVSGEPTFGIYFRYTDTVNGGRYQAVCDNGSETAVDTGVAAVAAAVDTMEIRVNEGATAVEFLINDVLVATITTNIPASSLIGFAISAVRTVGTAATNAYAMDYMLVQASYAGR